jgi:ADP-ribosylglycohydrolase
MKPALYGMPIDYKEALKNSYIMGCSLDFPMATWGCSECDYLVYQDGTFANPRRDRALGAVFGLATGDAVGEPYEFKPPITDKTPLVMDTTSSHHPGLWTDDTAMAIGIMQAWVKNGNIASSQGQDELIAIWRKWCESAVDSGFQTRSVLFSLDELTADRALKASFEHHEKVGRSGGNGSLMRTAPLAFLNGSDEEVARVTRQVSKLTHWDDEAAEACIIWVFAIRHAIKTRELDFESGFDYIPEDAKDKWRGYLEEAKNNPPVHFENNGWVVSAFKAAASAVIIGEYSFVTGIEAAVRAGYDTDTVAAIAGSLLGALHGLSRIPENWVEQLHGWPKFDNYALLDLTEEVLSLNR